MTFSDLQLLIKDEAYKGNFVASSNLIQQKVFNLEKEKLIPLVVPMGTIPEVIGHDTTEEKLYSKVSDIVLSKCFQELGLKATVNKERANCADVVAKSIFHNYTLVADAKAFRLSRTAKNQKDFKVQSMADWRGDSDYSVLVCPYYQYPKMKSQIYGQALTENVSLFSWEYLSILLENNVVESELIDLSTLWSISSVLSSQINIADKNNCFFVEQDKIVQKYAGLSNIQFKDCFKNYKNTIVLRGQAEIKYWQDKIEEIKNYSPEKAIAELLIALKLKEKIAAIKKCIQSFDTVEGS